ncbi:O-antigen ligase family protein [Holdemania massiliensis]|uniref:O-antigen ligase domain-containing protein n=2 Tax=Holdemania massiliensis TaxID=1468449 RepID=A0A6N7S6F0_9FIRM|nr:O-antigen ligase family protein [Holdemania massiliensis]MSA71137.1 hypothetical protein [Holdemania massiliensis]MSA89463.1 hypothetical protein [Holdemania massiliensis]MSB78238.1 hypothetical protein [Holdemania massiliensis]MSC33141.1 hypothetical protein [Holdemania massiliensis]MSC39549.1 hypothetical protein [Holdemania massiliensis]
MNKMSLKCKRNRHVQCNLKLRSVFQYFFIICIILNFRSLWLHTETFSWMARFVKVLLGVSVIGGILCSKLYSAKRIFQCLVAILGIVLYVGFWYLVDPLKKGGFLAILLQLLAIVTYSILVEDSIDNTLHKFTNIVLVIALISLFFWLFGSLLKFIKPTGYIYTTWTSNSGTLKQVSSYYGIYFETQSLTFLGLTSNVILRNTAIFTEAPMASLVFFISFIYELFLKERINIYRLILLGIAVVSTISTTGYMLMIIAITLRYFFVRSKSQKQLKIFILPATIIVMFFILNFLLEQKLGTGSGSIRIDDFIAGYRAWINAPLFGNGYGNLESYQKYMSSFRNNNLGISNSPMQILAFGGIYLIFPYIISILTGFTGMIKMKRWKRLSFYLLFLCSFIITICPFQMLTFYLFVCLVKESGKISFFTNVRENKRGNDYR